MAGIKDEGSITFWASGPHADWATNANGYNFPPASTQGVSVNSRKTPDGYVEVTLDGALGQTTSFRHKMPQCGPKGLFIGVTWKRPEVKLYLNGELAETKTV